MRDFGFGVAIPISFMHAGKKSKKKEKKIANLSEAKRFAFAEEGKNQYRADTQCAYIREKRQIHESENVVRERNATAEEDGIKSRNMFVKST